MKTSLLVFSPLQRLLLGSLPVQFPSLLLLGGYLSGSTTDESLYGLVALCASK
jgi:hypothetical protein